MTKQTTDGEVMREISGMTSDISPTAANAWDRKFGPSGEQTYRCALENAMVPSVDVQAATGDEAATAALSRYPGAKVVHIEPAPQAAQV